MIRNSATSCNCVNEYRAVDVFASLASFMASLPGSLVEVLETWQRRSMDRKHLENMSGHLLDDMGITYSDVKTEISKPFWKA